MLLLLHYLYGTTVISNSKQCVLCLVLSSICHNCNMCGFWLKGWLPLATHKLLSNSHILPYIDYCSLVLGDSPHVYNILKAQKQVAHTILDVKGKAISDPENRSHLLFSKLNWMNIFNWVKFRKATMVYKCLNNLAPQYMCNMFNYVTNSHNTRHSTQKDLEVPTGTQKVLFENSFRYSTVNEWNNIKPYIRNCASLNSFKLSYIKNHFNSA